jgi:hypothetical protein
MNGRKGRIWTWKVMKIVDIGGGKEEKWFQFC